MVANAPKHDITLYIKIIFYYITVKFLQLAPYQLVIVIIQCTSQTNIALFKNVAVQLMYI